MVQVYDVPLCKRHLASRRSLAYLFSVFFWIIVIVLPYFIAFASWGFWKTEAVYREQPIVDFKHKLVMSMDSQDWKKPIFYSTMPEFNELIGYEHVRMPIITSSKVDHNHDGVTDLFNISITMPVLMEETVHRTAILLFFQLQLQNRVKLQMEGLGVVMKESVLPGSEYHVNGDIVFHQLNPISSKGSRSTYADPVLKPEDIRSIGDLSFPNLLSKYFLRNDTIQLNVPNSYWVAGQRSTFKIQLNLRVPTQDISYVPDASETIKLAWIQYISVAIVVFVVCDWFRFFVFSQQVVETSTRLDTVPLEKQHQF